MINRTALPEKKTLLPRGDDIRYPVRWNKSMFHTLDRMLRNPNLLADYEMWKRGINPNTRRCITIGGVLHSQLETKFRLYQQHYDEVVSVLFIDLMGINRTEYHRETERLPVDIDQQHAKINAEYTEYNNQVDKAIVKINALTDTYDYVEFDGKKYGRIVKIERGSRPNKKQSNGHDVDEYNTRVDEACKQIEALTRWYDYVEFDGKMYGLSYSVVDDIHIRDDCGGTLRFTETIQIKVYGNSFCKGCISSFNEPCSCVNDYEMVNRYVYTCDKCGYEEHRITHVG